MQKATQGERAWQSTERDTSEYLERLRCHVERPCGHHFPFILDLPYLFALDTLLFSLLEISSVI